MIENRTILHGDVMEQIKKIPDEYVDCIITSPPYWGLRDYQVEGQWGLENEFQIFLQRMNDLMKELYRVLKKTGTCFINLGDTYSSNSKLFEKSLTCIPWEFLVQCRNNGWIIRNVIPWIKENPMPQSTTDRFTNFWEPVFFMVKNKKYNFDLDAVRLLAISQEKKITKQLKSRKPKSDKQSQVIGADGKPKANYKGFNERWKEQKESGKYGEDKQQRSRNVAFVHGVTGSNEKGKNPGDVLFINPAPFPEAHFATFPIELPKTLIKCGCPKDGIVFDPFMGAGTTALAAELLNRKWIGIELNQEYIDLSRKRLRKHITTKLTEWM